MITGYRYIPAEDNVDVQAAQELRNPQRTPPWIVVDHILSGVLVTRDEESELVLNPPWSDACSPLLHATMAFGAPELLNDAEISALLHAWRTVFAAAGDRP